MFLQFINKTAVKLIIFLVYFFTYQMGYIIFSVLITL